MVFGRQSMAGGVLVVLLCASMPALAQDQAFRQALELYKAGSLEQARAVLLASIGTHPTGIDFSLLGTIDVSTGRLDDAEQHLRYAIKLEPGLVGARLTLARVLLSKGDATAAEQVCREALTRDPNNVEALFELGAILLDQGQFSDAKLCLEKARSRAPKDVRVLLKLARLRNVQSDPEGSLTLLIEARKLQPNDFSVLYAFGAVCLEMDLFKDATAALEEAVKLNPVDQKARYALASARVANKNIPAAVEIYEGLLKEDPENAQLNYALGTAYYLAGDNIHARLYLNKSIRLMPQQVESYYYLAEIGMQEGEAEKSIELLRMVIDRSPGHVRAHISLGMAYRAMGRLADAERELEAAALLDPQSQKAHYQLGLVLAKLKEADRATKELEMADQLRVSAADKVSWELAPAPKK
jgi:tetratricopeptide (TPR) repeat protein